MNSVSRVHSRHVPAALCSSVSSQDTAGLDRKRYQGFCKREGVSALSVLVAQAQKRILGSGRSPVERLGDAGSLAWRRMEMVDQAQARARLAC